MTDLLLSLIAIGIPCITFWFAFKTWLDRMHPPHKPDPSGKELLESLEKHKSDVKKEIDALAGRIAFREKPRLRE